MTPTPHAPALAPASSPDGPWRVTVLYDNDASAPGTRGAWGLSVLARGPGGNVLLDTGWDGSLLLDNAAALGEDLSDLDLVVLSHGHWDHAGGLPQVLGAAPRAAVAVPASVTGHLRQEIARRAAALVVVDGGPRELLPGVHTTGALPTDTDGLTEQGLVLASAVGVALLTGCAHPGLQALMERAAAVGPLCAVMGGFHGFDDPEALAGVPQLYPGHCTVHRRALLARFSDTARPMGVGLCARRLV